ncbi:FecR domain-containing protein [Pedobacter sp. ASV1-7]|uniref:FecR family protein n=1 Tax=Pedobacter sp. ASV1-7 TaxID=3145237 RepID=UPI0032E8AD39
MNKEEIVDLLDRYLNGKATPEEEEKLNLWYHQEVGLSDWSPETDTEEIADLLKQKIDADIDHERIIKRKNWYRYISAAAAVLIVSAVSFYFFVISNPSGLTTAQLSRTADIAPGNNKAILTLADGTKISLTDVGNGELATQSGISITKNANGELVYTVNPANQTNLNASISYNTISTPKGGQYQVNLPDGTKIWLNSSSSLKFPVNFSTLKERKVDLVGEAYFEVKSDKNKPFRVQSEQQTIEVLGTHFNVMAYPNEKNLETTLLEGKVSVKTRNSETFITPGEQSQLKDGNIKVLKLADPEAVVAWKNKLFQFDNTDIDKVLRQIERWYDVEVNYVGAKPDVYFTGVIPRDVKVSRILMALEQACGVRFVIEGRTITTTNYKTKN